MGWQKTRIKFKLLALPRNRGGICLPDLKKIAPSLLHYQNNRLALSWDKHGLGPIRTQYGFSTNTFFIHDPFTPKQIIIKKHPLIANTLNIWYKIATTHKLASIPGPLTSITNNPNFIPGLHQKNIQNLLATHCMTGTRVKTFKTLQSELSKSFPGLWFYIQMKDFLVNSKHKPLYCILHHRRPGDGSTHPQTHAGAVTIT